MEQEIIELERICAVMYETSDANMRQRAQKILVELVNDPHVLQKCQLLLQRSASPFTLLIAASTLTKRVTKRGPSLSMQERLDIRNYVLNYLYTGNGPKSTAFVKEELSLLFSRITKLSWFESSKDEWYFRHVMSDISKFLQGDTNRSIMGVHLLSDLVADMNRSDNVRPLTRHRKIAASFRDMTLFDIFQLACRLLSQALVSGEQIQGDEQLALIGAVLRLTLSCMSFDFIGTSYDESGDDLGTVQIPTGWRATFVDLSNSQMFLKLYNVLPESLSSVVMACLVQVVSVRRSLFNNPERAKFLSDILKTIKGILENPQKMSDETTFHEFCRMLARLKANYQLGELVKAACYTDCIQLIANFTITSLRMWHFSPNSIHYLLSLWQRMAASVPYVKAQEPHMLESYMPEILKAYVESRLESVEIVVRDGLENQLEDMSFIKQQLEQVSAIGRCDYMTTWQLLFQIFNKIASQLQDLLGSSGENNQPLVILLGKLTWIVYLIGTVIGGRVSFSATDAHDAMDGELVVKVLQLMTITDARLAAGNGFATIELAFLSFFDQFRKIYVGDQVQKTSKVYQCLNDSLHIADDSAVLGVFVTKIITNLKYWSNNDEIISRTLHLFNDLAVGFSSVRKLVKLEAVQFLLADSPSTHFPFLGIDSKVTDFRCRTVFYTSLGRILMVDLGEDNERFMQFMTPMTNTFHTLKQLLSNASANNAAMNAHTIRTLVGVARDCRGLAYAFNTKSCYSMLFDLVYPAFTDILQRSVALWYHDPQVTTPVLKFFAELALKRGQRLEFDVSSPNGILLFKEASKLVCTYGDSVLSMGEPPKDQLYTHKLKGISLCFRLLKNALCGGYVNFGVFRLYNDPTLNDALNVFAKLVVSIESSYLLDYPKLSTAYYKLLEVVVQDHMGFVSGFPAGVTYQLLTTLSDGLTALDTEVCTCCCNGLDHVVTYLFRIANLSSGLIKSNMTSLTGVSVKQHHDVIDRQKEQHFLQVIHERQYILQNTLSTILNTILFGECRNQWSMSRPLLGLILVNQEYMVQLQKSICEPTIDHGVLSYDSISKCFTKLMVGVQKNLHMKNRDKFTQNLSLFCRDINDIIKTDSTGRPSVEVGVNLTTNASNMMT